MTASTDSVPKREAPEISVVVTSLNGFPALDRCLKALENQRGGISAEVIVAGCAQPGLADYVSNNFPEVKLVYSDRRITIPELRATGISRANGDIVVITEDRCIPSEDWLLEISKSHGSEYQVVGGPIEPDGIRGILNWAVYLCEYSSLMMPVPEGEVSGVAGNNSSYRKETLERIPETIRKNYWEYFLHQELRIRGVRFLSSPSVIVRKKIDFSFPYFLGQRFHYSRSFAGMRRKQVAPLKRLVYASITPGLPLLMTWRIAREVLRKKRYRKELLLSLPMLCAFMASYAAGEFIGYLFGTGTSLHKVE